MEINVSVILLIYLRYANYYNSEVCHTIYYTNS